MWVGPLGRQFSLDQSFVVFLLIQFKLTYGWTSLNLVPGVLYFSSWSWVKKGEPLGLVKLEVACVASVSARVHRERRDERKKKGMTGEGEGKEGTNFRAITGLETPRRLNWRSLKWDCRLVESNNREVRRYLFKANFLLTVLTQEEP